MRTNNSKVKNIIISIYFVLIVLSIFSATVFSIFKHLTPNPFITYALIAVFYLGLFFLVYRVSKYFEYDSDGEKVIIINRGLLLTEYFNYREHKLEFDKDRLLGFKFNNMVFYKTLDIYIRDKKENKKKETFNVTLVTKKKRRYIRQSLSKIIKLQGKQLEV